MIYKLFKSITDWQEKTFPKTTAKSKAIHLSKEVKELIEAIESDIPNDIEVNYELADCQILLWGIVKKRGLTHEQFQRVIMAKMEINERRNWNKPNPDGTVFHIKEE